MFTNYANQMADFIISRAFILLLISIFLFPLIILITPSITQQDLALSCHQERASYSSPSSLISGRLATIETQIPPGRPWAMETYTISLLAWWTCPPRIPLFESKRKKKSRKKLTSSIWTHFDIDRAWHYLRKTGLQTLCRTLLFASLWLCSPQWLPSWLVCLPLLEWIVSAICLAWPALAQQPEATLLRGLLSNTRLITGWLLAATIVYQWLSESLAGVDFALDNYSLRAISPSPYFVVSKTTANSAPNAQISISKFAPDDKPAYQINLSGEFYLTVDRTNSFWMRMVIIFLRQLQTDSVAGLGRLTRDGRRPLVSQTRLAEAFNLTQPEISLWEKYWLNKDWPNLLSQKSAQILTIELRQQIVEAFASRPWWGMERVYQYLHSQGIKVTRDQIQQAATDSGWRHLRQTLNRFFIVSEENIRPRDEALVKQLLNQLNNLLAKLKNSDQLTPQEELDISYLSLAADELGVTRDKAQVSFWGQKTALRVPLGD